MVFLASETSFIESIANGLYKFFEAIFSFFESLSDYLSLLTTAVLDIPDYFSWLPASAVAIIGTIVAIAVLSKILGRDG